MPTATPSWTEADVISRQTLTKGSLVRNTVDLRTKFGGYLFTGVGKLGATVPANGIVLRVSRLLGNDVTVHPDSGNSRLSNINAPNATTLSGSISPGAASFTVTSATGFAADDVICISGTTTAVGSLANAASLATLELVRISKVASTTITTDAPIKQSHASGELCVTKADAFAPIYLPGGAVYEVIFDYGDDATGDTVAVFARIQTYDSDTIA